MEWLASSVCYRKHWNERRSCVCAQNASSTERRHTTPTNGNACARLSCAVTSLTSRTATASGTVPFRCTPRTLKTCHLWPGQDWKHTSEIFDARSANQRSRRTARRARCGRTWSGRRWRWSSIDFSFTSISLPSCAPSCSYFLSSSELHLTDGRIKYAKTK